MIFFKFYVPSMYIIEFNIIFFNVSDTTLPPHLPICIIVRYIYNSIILFFLLSFFYYHLFLVI